MWFVVRHQYGCAPEIVAMFARCCQATERVVQLSGEFPKDRFYPRFEGNFRRRSIDDIPMNAGENKKSKKTKKSKLNALVLS